MAKRYFQAFGYRHWVFAANVQTPTDGDKSISLFRLDSLTIERHVKVKGTASPDDPELHNYWQQRQQRHGKRYWSRGSKYYRLAQSQHWRCPVCGEALINGEEVHAHHRSPVRIGGMSLDENLQLLHHACHRQVHGQAQTSVVS